MAAASIAEPKAPLEPGRPDGVLVADQQKMPGASRCKLLASTTSSERVTGGPLNSIANACCGTTGLQPACLCAENRFA